MQSIGKKLTSDNCWIFNYMAKEKETKYLFCPKCKEYPDVITENYNQPFWQTRKWNGECYELRDDALSEIEYTQDSKFHCGNCETKLIDDDTPEEEEQSCRKCGKILPKGWDDDMCFTCRKERS